MRFSISHLPPSFLAARLPTPFTSLNLYAKTRGAKCLPLQVKNKLKTKIDTSLSRLHDMHPRVLQQSSDCISGERKNMDINVGLFSEQGINWMVIASWLWSLTLYPHGGWSQVVFLKGLVLRVVLFSTFINNTDIGIE